MVNWCCCIPLRSAGIVIGVLNIIGSLAVGFLTLSLTWGFAVIDYNAYLITNGCVTGMWLLVIPSSTYLIIGIIKKKHYWILPWLICNCFVMFFEVCALVRNEQLRNNPFSEKTTSIVTSTLVVLLIIQIYAWFIILSIKKNIQFSNDQKSPENYGILEEDGNKIEISLTEKSAKSSQ